MRVTSGRYVYKVNGMMVSRPMTGCWDERMVEPVSCAQRYLYPGILHVLTCEFESDVLSPRLVRTEDTTYTKNLPHSTRGDRTLFRHNAGRFSLCKMLSEIWEKKSGKVFLAKRPFASTLK